MNSSLAPMLQYPLEMDPMHMFVEAWVTMEAMGHLLHVADAGSQ